MSEETGDSRFLEAILNRVFDAVSEHGSFNEESVKHLKELARSKDMTDFNKVADALRAETGE